LTQVVRHGLGAAPVVAGHQGDRKPGLLESGDEHPGAWRRCCIGTAFREAGYNDTSPRFRVTRTGGLVQLTRVPT